MSGRVLERQVLVLGEGETARRVQELLGKEGFSVTAPPPAEAPVAQGPRLVDLQGELGDFTAIFAGPGQWIRERAGAVVIACESRREPALDILGEPGRSRVWTLSQVESAAERGESPAESGQTVLFLDRPDGAATPASEERLLRAILALQDRGITCRAFCPQMKVAARDLEILYGRARDRGCLFFRSEAVSLEMEPDGVTALFEDPVLQEELRIAGHALVLGETDVPAPVLFPLRAPLKLEADDKGYLQAENVLRIPCRTNRRGVFVIGPSAGPPMALNLDPEIQAAAAEIRSLYDWAETAPEEPPIAFTRERCARCLTCYRACPHGAIHFTDRPHFLSLACQECGICTALCPNRALALRNHETASAWERMAPGNAPKTENPVETLVFACEKSGGRILTELSQAEPGLKGLEWISLPCAGTLRMHHVLTAIADTPVPPRRIVILACHEGNCRSTRGTLQAKAISERINALLKELGWDGTAVDYVTAAPNETARVRKMLWG